MTKTNDIKLEEQYRPAYIAWKTSKTPESQRLNMGHLLNTVKPDISKGIFAHTSSPNPLLESEARRLTVQAIKSYDPAKAGLGTHIMNHLQGLRRADRQQTQIMPVPERVSLEQGRVAAVSRDMENELGREPSTQELADKTGLSLKRLAYLRKFQTPIPEGMAAASMDEEGETVEYSTSVQQPSQMPVEVVYQSASGIDQKIMEWTLGLHGNDKLANQEIAARLGITPGAVTQRKKNIQSQLDNMVDLMV